MLPRLRRALLTVVLAGALLPLSATAADDTIVGYDGVTYPASPPVIEGRHGDLFYGLAFDLMCEGGGAQLETSMKKLTKLTKLIRRSGRQVVFTVVPDKSLVNPENVVSEQLPHGSCDQGGMSQQRAVLDTFTDPSYLPLREALVAQPGQTFWRTDVHWTSVGASVYARALATRLSKPLGARQKYTKGKPQTEVGYLNQLRDDDTPETVKTFVPDTAVKVTEKPGTDSLDQQFPLDHAWSSKPADLTYPGRTLLLGDSFTVMGLENMRPIFRHGHFLWVKNIPDATIAKAIRKSDTVVIEVVQFFASVSPLATASFRRLVKKELS